MKSENDNQNKSASERGLSIRLFGAFETRVNDSPIPPLRSRKVQWLLALLVLRHDQALDRAWLAGTLWPESAPDQALYNLRQSLSNLRRALNGTGLHFDAPAVNALSLNLAGAVADVIAFDAAIADGTQAGLERAVGLYRGPLLEGCDEEWVVSERRVREESYLSALAGLADQSLAQGEADRAISYLRTAVQADPFRERTQRALLQALAGAGEVGEALQAYRDLRMLLRRELNADPDPDTVTLFQRIQQEARSRTPPLLARSAPPRSRRFIPAAGLLDRLGGQKARC